MSITLFELIAHFFIHKSLAVIALCTGANGIKQKLILAITHLN